MTQVGWVNQKAKLMRVANEGVAPAGERILALGDNVVAPGDIILHYTDQYIVAVSEANNVAIPS